MRLGPTDSAQSPKGKSQSETADKGESKVLGLRTMDYQNWKSLPDNSIQTPYFRGIEMKVWDLT